MKNTFIIIILFMGIILMSCNQVRLDNNEAEGLIKNTLELPKSYRYDVGWGNGVSMFGASGPLDALQSAGLITYKINYHGAFTDPSLHLSTTDFGKPYFLGQNSNVYKFKTNDIDFDKITGISINKESQTAIIRFSLKATNVTIAGYALAREKYIRYSLSGSIIGELVYKKFDNGWQLETEQGKPSSELLNQILESESNANSNEDYSVQIQNLRDEFNAKKEALEAKYSSHRDFTQFWDDFKKAIVNSDKQSVEEMTRFPFTDFNEFAYGRNGLTCKTSNDFSNMYSKIFPSCALGKISNDELIKIDPNEAVDMEQNAGAEYWLFLRGDCDGNENVILGYVFGKENGRYKLLGLKYLS